MYKYLSVILFTYSALQVNAQNSVGINTTNPQASLDVRGNYRVGGSNKYISFDSTNGRIQWTGAAVHVPTLQPVIIRSLATREGLWAGGGRLEYRDDLSTAFFVDWPTGSGYFKRMLGIDMLTPYSPLTFATSLGEKISLYGNSTNNYGFGIQNATLQIHSDAVGADIAFGYGSSSSFSEVMRIRGNGALSIRGNAGSAGQILQSSGADASPSWVSSTNALYNNTNLILGTGEVLVGAGPLQQIPGLQYTFSTSGNAKVMVSFSVSAAPPSCFACGRSTANIGVVSDGTVVRLFSWNIDNGSWSTLTGTDLISLGPGTHTIQIKAGVSGPDVKFGSSAADQYNKDTFIVQVIPQ